MWCGSRQLAPCFIFLVCCCFCVGARQSLSCAGGGRGGGRERARVCVGRQLFQYLGDLFCGNYSFVRLIFSVVSLLALCVPAECIDSNAHCIWWAREGQCNDNPGYMRSRCKLSCNVCTKGDNNVAYNICTYIFYSLLTQNKPVLC